MSLRHRMLTFGAGLAVLAIATACSGPGPATPTQDPPNDVRTLRMGVVPTDELTETFNQWEFAISLIEEDTGYKIDLFQATDVAAVIEAAIAGDLDIINLGPFHYFIAQENGANMRNVGVIYPTAAKKENASMAVVRSDSGISRLEDLKGKDLCFVSPSTTSTLFGMAEFINLGFDTDNDIHAIFVGDHASAVRAMYDGECAAAFTYRDYAERVFFKDNPEVGTDEVTIIWNEVAPQGTLSISRNLPEDVQEELHTVLLNLNGTNVLADGRCPTDRIVTDEDLGVEFCGVLQNLWWGLEEVDDSYWEPLADVCRLTESPACTS